MTKLQPEGGHVPIEHEHRFYRRVVAGLDVLALPFEEVEGRAKLGQNHSAETIRRILSVLWQRGESGVDALVATILDARPELELPDFLRGPAGTRLCCRPRDAEVDAAVALVDDEYWNETTPSRTIRRAHLRSPVWVGARDPHGRLIATARATSDGAKHAWIYDVAVAPDWRGRGIGQAVLELLLDHPLVREARYVHLQTKDAQTFYAKLGFVPHPTGATPRYVRHHLVS